MGFFSNQKAQEGVRKQRLNAYNVIVLLALAPFSITYGYHTGIIAATFGQPSFFAYFDLTSSVIGAISALFFVGGVIGPLVLPVIADRYGRKRAIAFSTILCLISAAFLAGSTNIGEFIFFRFVSGAGSFMLLAAIPLLMNEVVPSSMRGGLVELHAVFFILGFLIAAWIGFGFSFWVTNDLVTWRLPFAIGCFFPLLGLSTLYWIPESPRWLMMKGRDEEARVILNKLHSDKSNEGDEYASAEYYQIQKQIHIDNTLGSSWMHIIRKPSYRKRALVAIALTFFIQSSGDLVINNYGPILYKSLGFGVVKQLLYPAAWSTFTLGMSVLALPLVDRIPRNVMVAIGLWGAGACLAAEAGLVAVYIPSTNENALNGAVAMFFVFQVFDTIFLNAPEWAYLGELFPTHIRAKGMCLGISMLALINIVYTQLAPIAFANVGWKFYLLFILLCFISGFIVLFLFPDTRGLPLEEIAAMFGDEDEVAVYQAEIEVDLTTHRIIDHHGEGTVEEKLNTVHGEKSQMV